jgi:hypothetical protein
LQQEKIQRHVLGGAAGAFRKDVQDHFFSRRGEHRRATLVFAPPGRVKRRAYACW